MRSEPMRRAAVGTCPLQGGANRITAKPLCGWCLCTETQVKAFLKKLYLKAPVFVKRMYAAVPVRWRMGAVFRREYDLLAESEWWDAERLAALQMARLRDLLADAYANVPYYRRVFDELGMKPEDVKTLDDFRRLPTLTKSKAKELGDELHNRTIPRWKTYFATTGGTTGEPFGFYLDDRSYEIEWAFMLSQWKRAGYDPGQRKITLRGKLIEAAERGVFWEENPIYNEMYLSSYHLTAQNFPRYLDAIRRFRPTFIHGYPSAVSLLAHEFLNHAGSLEGLGFKAVLAGSERIFPEQRRLMERAFDCRVYSWYGQTEKVILAGACEEANVYHVFPQYGITEVLDPDGNPCPPGVVGELIGTGFMNHYMPLVRYHTGDRGALGSEFCASCGRQYPLIAKLEGRVQDMVVTDDGRLIPITGMVFGAHMEEYARIRKLQLVQDAPGKVLVKVVPEAGFGDAECRNIVNEYKRISGGGLEIEVEVVDDIPTTKAGKHRYLIQNVDLKAKEPPG
jgi:phenylacetate-CoA ligase